VLLDAALRAARPGDDRITGNRDAAEGIARACGGLLLALQITAALLKADPALTTADLAGELAEETARLERLAYDDGSETGKPSVAAAFELSFSRLDATAARVFRLLPVNPGPDTSTAAAAVIADLPVSEVRMVLGRLARAHLAEAVPGDGRWRMHDLMRLYAQRLSDDHAEADGREQARDRLLGSYLDLAKAADKHLRALPCPHSSPAVMMPWPGTGLAGCRAGQPGGRSHHGDRYRTQPGRDAVAAATGSIP
jgi:hypothetical protein